VSSDLREEIELELAQLQQLLEKFRPLLTCSGNRIPTNIETLAVAGLLHAFYTGIENLFKRVSIHLDGGPPSGAAWHSQILDSIAKPSSNRPAVANRIQGFMNESTVAMA